MHPILGLVVTFLCAGCVASHSVLQIASPVREDDSTRAFWRVTAIQSAYRTTNDEIMVLMFAKPPNKRHGGVYHMNIPVGALATALDECTFINSTTCFEFPKKWSYKDPQRILMCNYDDPRNDYATRDCGSLPLTIRKIDAATNAITHSTNAMEPLMVVPLDCAGVRIKEMIMIVDGVVKVTGIAEISAERFYYGQTADGNALFAYVSTNTLYHGSHILPFRAASQPYENKWRRCYLVLLPPAVAFDIVTFPIQAIVAVDKIMRDIANIRLP